MKPIYLILVALVFTVFSCQDAKKCQEIKCQNNGSCTDGTCACPDGYRGIYCENVDSCSLNLCKNSSTCQDGQCICPDSSNYEGRYCEVEKRQKFVGNYKATEKPSVQEPGRIVAANITLPGSGVAVNMVNVSFVIAGVGGNPTTQPSQLALIKGKNLIKIYPQTVNTDTANGTMNLDSSKTITFETFKKPLKTIQLTLRKE